MQTTIPTGLISINSDISSQVLGVVQQRLYITETIDGYALEQRLISNPDYSLNVKRSKQRILIIDSDNQVIDISLFIYNGLVYIEKYSGTLQTVAIPVYDMTLRFLYNL